MSPILGRLAVGSLAVVSLAALEKILDLTVHPQLTETFRGTRFSVIENRVIERYRNASTIQKIVMAAGIIIGGILIGAFVGIFVSALIKAPFFERSFVALPFWLFPTVLGSVAFHSGMNYLDRLVLASINPNLV